jgi:hypothetical protein
MPAVAAVADRLRQVRLVFSSEKFFRLKVGNRTVCSSLKSEAIPSDTHFPHYFG